MSAPHELNELFTPAAVIDVDRMAANLQKMAGYVAQQQLGLWPHTKTHKTPELAREQLRNGATGLTVATLHEAEKMATVSPDLLLAYPPVGTLKLMRLAALAERAHVTVAVDSAEALDGLQQTFVQNGLRVGVLIEIDVGMRRVGVGSPEQAVQLARVAADARGLDYAGIMFYPGHIRQPVSEQDAVLVEVSDTLHAFLSALERAGLPAERISGGSTPTAYASHRMRGVREIRPGTYIFNDRTTAALNACGWNECAYSVLATVVSTAVAQQAVVDAGSKALSREELRAPDASGFGALLDRPEVFVKGLSEEHGLLDLSQTDWQPRVGERVRIVPNHVCVSVNLHDRLWLARGAEVLGSYRVAARGW